MDARAAPRLDPRLTRYVDTLPQLHALLRTTSAWLVQSLAAR